MKFPNPGGSTILPCFILFMASFFFWNYNINVFVSFLSINIQLHEGRELDSQLTRCVPDTKTLLGA